MEDTYDRLLEEVRRFWAPLADKPEETAERLLCALWQTACGTPVSVDRAARTGLPVLEPAASGRLLELLERKKSGEPLAHLTGRQTFLGLEFLAGPEALIPRKETEILGRAALGKLSCLRQERGPLFILDVCTGSGNLALAYAWYQEDARVYASDICQNALELARRNLAHLDERVPLAGRVEFRQGDLLAPFDGPEFHGRCDFLSCNPPYISAGRVKQMHPEISQFEPEAAFNGGIYGVSVLTRLLKQAARFLKPDGWLGFEVGSGQGAGIARQLERNPAFTAIETYADAAGEIRAVLAKAKSAAPA